MKRTLIALALVLSAATAVQAQIAGCACGTPRVLPTPWLIRHSDPVAQSAAQGTFAQWNTYFDLFRPTVAPAAYDPNSSFGNGLSEVTFLDFSVIPGLDPNSVLGYTPSLPDGAFGDFNGCPMPAGTSCGTITEADVLINQAVPWNDSPPNIDRPGFAGYYRGTLVHELGHSLGLHHNFGNFSTMNYYADYACLYITQMDVLVMRNHMPSQAKTVSDLATYAFTYDYTQQTGSSDGDNALTVANVSPAAIAPGGSITIKNWRMENLSSSAKEALLLFYLSSDTHITSSDIYLGGFHWASLASNQYADDTAGSQFKIPANVPAGNYYVGAIVAAGSSAPGTQDSITYNNTWVIPTPISVGSSSGGTPTTCTPSSTNVCLVNNRFKVSMTFNNAAMQATPFTGGNTGLFAQTSDPSNIEVLLKMIDACGFNAKFWVYSGGTTDQGVVITVLDTKTGTTKTYTNAKGTKFQTITDSGAFNCP